MKTITLLFVITFLLTNCGDKNRHSSNKSPDNAERYTDIKTLEPNGTIEVKIDTLTKFWTLCLQRIEIDGVEHLAYENAKKPSIQIYNLETGELYHEMFLKRKGPMGIGQLRGFYIHNLDSTFIVTGSLYNVYLVDKTGGIITKFDLRKLLPNTIADSHAYSFNPIYYSVHNGQLYIPSSPGKNPGKKGFWNGDVAIKIDARQNTAEYIYQAPKEYHDFVYGAFFIHFSTVQKENGDFVYAFPFDSELFVTDYQGEFEKYYAGSKYFDEVPEKDNNTSHEQHYIESDSYADLLYDKWRKVYYRVAFRAIEMIDKDGNRNTWDDKIPSLIILDEHFKKIGEVDLPKETYLIKTNSFVGKKGLYISNNHIKNINIDENKLSFTLFTLEDI